MDNPFEFHEEDTIIACVGDNGGTTDDDIRNGSSIGAAGWID